MLFLSDEVGLPPPCLSRLALLTLSGPDPGPQILALQSVPGPVSQVDETPAQAGERALHGWRGKSPHGMHVGSLSTGPRLADRALLVSL